MNTFKKSSKGGILEEVRTGFESLGGDMFQTSKQAVKDSFSDINSQFMASPSPFKPETNQDSLSTFNPEQFANFGRNIEKKEPKRIRKSEIIFNLTERREQARISNEIRELMKVVKQEVELLKAQDQGLINDLSKLTLSELGAQPGIYHLRFLEFIIRLLRTIRKKVSEGRLWLQSTFQKKKAKKFRGLAKSKGTKFSMSKELSQANIPG